uniref:CCHC-type domain-containing protein n=1 Tax=Podarcis muralis TaxID=64176 RepID=A0A670K1J2_PODMU
MEDSLATMQQSLRTIDQWGVMGEASSLPVETNPIRTPSPSEKSASWFSDGSQEELVDSSIPETVRKGQQETCRVEGGRAASEYQTLTPREEVQAEAASARPRESFPVYTESREMDFSEGLDVEWMRDPVDGGFRSREKCPKVGQAIRLAPRYDRMAYDFQSLPQQQQEVTERDCSRAADAPDVCRKVGQPSFSPGKVYSPVNAQPLHVPVRRYVEEEEEFNRRPQREYAIAAERRRPDGWMPPSRVPRYEPVSVRGGNQQQPSPPGLTLNNLNWRVFQKYQPPTDVLCYLNLFEVTCKDMGVAPELYMVVLRSLVCGDLAELMGNLPQDDLNNYEKFKRLVMRRLGLHPEQYRKAFRKVEKGGLTDNIAVFSAKMAQNFELWLAAEGVQDAKDIKQLLLIEQLMRSLSPEIASLVADQKPRTLEEATSLAESFRVNRAHWATKGGNNANRPMIGSGRSAPPIKEPSRGVPTPAKDFAATGGERSKLSPTSGLCFLCKKPGHVKAACPQLGDKKPHILTSTPAVRMIQRPEEDWEEEQLKSGVEQGLALKEEGGVTPKAEIPAVPMTAVNVGPVSAGSNFKTPHVNWAKLEFSAPIEVNKTVVESYRDTGSDITSVSRDLVLPSQMQAKPLKISPYGVEEIFQPTAIVPLKYKGYSGDHLVIVHDPQVCKSPVLVGNDLGFQVYLQQQTKVNPVTVAASPTPLQAGTDSVVPETGLDGKSGGEGELPILDRETPKDFDASVELGDLGPKVGTHCDKLPNELQRVPLEANVLENLVPDREGGSLAPDTITPKTIETVETVTTEKLVGRRVGLIRIATPCVNEPCSASDVIPRVHRVVVPSFQSMDSVSVTLPKDSVLSPWNQPDFQKSNPGCGTLIPQPATADLFISKGCMGEPFDPGLEPQVSENSLLGENVLKSAVPTQPLAANPLVAQTVNYASVSCQPNAERQAEGGGSTPPSQAAVRSFEFFYHSLLGCREAAETPPWETVFISVVANQELFCPQLKDFKDPADVFIVFQKVFCNANGCVKKKVNLVGLLQNFSPRKQDDDVKSKNVFRFAWSFILPNPCVQNLLGMFRGKREGLEELKLIFSDLWPKRLKHVQSVLAHLQDPNLTGKKHKCQFAQGEVVYLGFRVGSGSIKTLEAKIQCIQEWPRPVVKKDVQSFIGLVNYYRRFINHFSTLAAPLTNLCKKSLPVKIEWTEECQRAFDLLKHALVSNQVMLAPDQRRPFKVQTDASQTGLGAVLLQEDQEKNWRPVVYLSKKLITREQNYSTIEKECFALVWALTKLRPYLWGTFFEVQTDHSPLCWLERGKNSNQKLARWSMALQEFRPVFEKSNSLANLLKKPGLAGEQSRVMEG